MSRDVSYTIDQLKNKQDKQLGKKKEKDDRNITYKSAVFRVVQISSTRVNILANSAPPMGGGRNKLLPKTRKK